MKNRMLFALYLRLARLLLLFIANVVGDEQKEIRNNRSKINLR